MQRRAGTTVLSKTVEIPASGQRSNPPMPLLSGVWQAIFDGFAIILEMNEEPSDDGLLQLLKGKGSLHHPGLSLELPFAIVGIHQAGPTGVWIHLESRAADRATKWYGHIMCQLDEKGALSGQFYSTGENSTGPLSTEDFRMRPISFQRVG